MLGAQIKRLRKANGMSQVELAGKVGVSKQSISNWEGDNIAPSIEMLKKLCGVFSCSADYLLGLEDDAQFHLDTTKLTLEQIAHIANIVADMNVMNQMLLTAGINIHEEVSETDVEENE